MLLLFILLLFSSVRSQDFCQPEQIRLSIRGDDGEFFIVTWTTFSEAESWVEFGLNPDDVKGQRVQGSKELFRDGGSLHRLEYIHRAVFPSLQPQKKYYYRVGSPCGWSDMFWFKTFPRTENWSPKFALYGDMGNVNAVSLPRLQQETEDGMYDMVLHIGDFAYDMFDENGTRGDQFMRQIEPLAAYVPYMTCPGNHEEAYNFSHYKYRFTMPDWRQEEIQSSQDLPMFYSFNVGPVHFISINTEYYYFLNYGASQLLRQYNWIIQDLEEATKPEIRAQRPWIVMFGHRPMYCSSDDKDDCTNHETRTRVGLPILKLYGLEEVLFNYKVDLALWAHEHDYERFWPLYDYQVKNGSYAHPYTNPKGPVHIITGSAGCQEKHDPWLPMPHFTAFRSIDYGYSRLTAHNKTHLEISQVSDDKAGKIIDHIWIIKENL